MRQSNNSKNKLKERALRIRNDGQKSNFQDLNSKYKEYTIHQINSKTFMMEKHKIINTVDSLLRENVLNTGSFQILTNSTKKTVGYGLETASYRSPI